MNRRQALLVASLVLLGGLGVAASFLWTHRDAEVQLQHPPLDPDAWTRYTAALRATPPPTGPQVDAVRAAFRAANQAEVAAGANPEKDVVFLAAVQTWERAALTLTQTLDTRAYFDLGRWEGQNLIQALDGFLNHCRDRKLSPADCLAAEPWPAPVRAYVDAGGAFVRFAERGGFIADGRLVEPLIPLLQAVFLQHWGSVLRRRVQVLNYLQPIEIEWRDRWRLEWQSDAPLERRLAAADQLRHVAGYPADLNAGALLFQAGRYAEAAARFEAVDSPLGHRWRRAARARAE